MNIQKPKIVFIIEKILNKRTQLNTNQGRHTRCGKYGERRTTFLIDFQISGALSHNAKNEMDWNR